jgi:excisionase family DNA binding protein
MNTTIPFESKLSATIAETCQATGIGRTKLYEELAAGRIQSTTVGRRRLILVKSVLRLLDPQAAPSGREAVR